VWIAVVVVVLHPLVKSLGRALCNAAVLLAGDEVVDVLRRSCQQRGILETTNRISEDRT
jgi:hypothetical protein